MNVYASSLDPQCELRLIHVQRRVRAPWPSVDALLALRRTQWFNIGRRCRFYWIALRSRHWRNLVDEIVSQCPAINAALAKHPVLFRPLATRFLNADSTLHDRFQAFAHDLAFTATRIHRSFPEFLPGTCAQQLWSGIGYSVELALNVGSPQEGLWRIDLKDPGGRCVFFASFSVVPGPAMFIGAIQGGVACADNDPRLAVRAATKAFEGLRPQYLLLQVLQCIASAWRVTAIVGVSDKHQVTRRPTRSPRAPGRFSYDGYFSESGAQRSPCGNWRVPLTQPDRAIGTVPSRKRSMYRRRWHQVQVMEWHINSRLGTHLMREPMEPRPAEYLQLIEAIHPRTVFEA